jgi:hypothetical protein
MTIGTRGRPWMIESRRHARAQLLAALIALAVGGCGAGLATSNNGHVVVTATPCYGCGQ